MISKNKIRKVIEKRVREDSSIRLTRFNVDSSIVVHDIFVSKLKSLFSDLKSDYLSIDGAPELKRSVTLRIDAVKMAIEEIEAELPHSYGITKELLEESLQSRKDQLKSDQEWVGRMHKEEESLVLRFEKNMHQAIAICEYLQHRGCLAESAMEE